MIKGFKRLKSKIEHSKEYAGTANGFCTLGIINKFNSNNNSDGQ